MIDGGRSITVDSASRFAEATGSPWTVGAGGTPLLYGVVLLREALARALSEAIPTGLGATVPILHGEHLVRLHAPLEVDTRLLPSARHLATEVKKAGTTVTVLAEIHSASGALLEEHEMTAFLPGAQLDHEVGGRTALPGRGVADPGLLDELLIATDPQQSRRYAVASGDDTVFHTSDEQARRYGFPGIIMHGLCTLAVISNTLAAKLEGDPCLIGVRFSAPGIPGEDIVVRYAKHSETQIGFDSWSPAGVRTTTLGFLSADPTGVGR